MATFLFLAPASLRAAESPPHVAWVTIAGTDEDADALTRALASPLAELGLDLRASRVSGDPVEVERERPRVVIDARSPDAIVILVWAGARADDPVRRTIHRDASSAIVVEETAYAVRATLDSLLSATAEPPPAPPPAPILPPPAPVVVAPPTPKPVDEPRAPRAPARIGVDGDAFFDARGLAASTPAFGGGVGLDVVFRGLGGFRPDVWIGGFLDAPVRATTSDVTLDTALYGLRIVPRLELAHVGPLRFVAAAGGGVDLFRVETSPGSTAATLRGSAVYGDPILEGALLVKARLASSVGVTLGFVLDGDLAPHHFSQVDGTHETTDLALWAARPAVTLGLCVALSGPSACAGEP